MRKSLHSIDMLSPPFLARLVLQTTSVLHSIFSFSQFRKGCIRNAIYFKNRLIIIGLFCLINPAFSGAQTQNGCNPQSANPVSHIILQHDGVFYVDGNIRLSLAGVLWPDALEQQSRDMLHQRITTALKDQVISWKPAGTPDRWGVTPAYIFVQETGAALPPFWLQAGLVEAGLIPAWPTLLEKSCWHMLRAHENAARQKNIGYWEPRAQAERHAVIKANTPAHEGRRLVARWQVGSVKSGRTVHFINFAGVSRTDSSLWLSQSQANAFAKIGKHTAEWQGKWIIVRFVVYEHGLRRIRIETADHVDILDEKQATQHDKAQ